MIRYGYERLLAYQKLTEGVFHLVIRKKNPPKISWRIDCCIIF